MNNNFKNDKFVEVVQEFQIVQGQSVYQIGSIDLKDVYFFVKNGNENYKVLATGQYTVDGVNLTINDPNIILTNTHIQVCRVYSTVASKYISDVVNINTLREHYNVLVDDFINVIDFLRKSGIKSDSSAMNYVFPLLEEGQVFMRKGLGFEGRQIMDINAELQRQIDIAITFFEDYINNQKKPEIDAYTVSKKQELETYTIAKKGEINTLVTGHKTDINTLADTKKTEIIELGNLKQQEIISLSTGKIKEITDVTTVKKQEIETLTAQKKVQITDHTDLEIQKILALGVDNLQTQINTNKSDILLKANKSDILNKENTIEDLIKSRKYEVGDVVEVLGYYLAGDGAGHPRQKKAAGYNGADAVVGNDGSIWGIVHSGEVNVSWFGAKGDGVTDDTVAIKKAVDSIDGNFGQTVIIPKGDFLIRNLVVNKAGVVFKGYGNKISRLVGDTELSITVQPLLNGNPFTNTGFGGIFFDNCQLYAISDVSRNTGVGLRLINCFVTNFTNLYVAGFKKNIELCGCHYNSLFNFYAVDEVNSPTNPNEEIFNRGYAISVSRETFTGEHVSSALKIDGGWLHNTSLDLENSANAVIRNIDIEPASQPVLVGNGSVWEGNRFERMDYYAVSASPPKYDKFNWFIVKGDDNTFRNNSIHSLGANNKPFENSKFLVEGNNNKFYFNENFIRYGLIDFKNNTFGNYCEVGKFEDMKYFGIDTGSNYAIENIQGIFEGGNEYKLVEDLGYVRSIKSDYEIKGCSSLNIFKNEAVQGLNKVGNTYSVIPNSPNTRTILGLNTTDKYKKGKYCIKFKLTSDGDFDIVFTPTLVFSSIVKIRCSKKYGKIIFIRFEIKEDNVYDIMPVFTFSTNLAHSAILEDIELLRFDGGEYIKNIQYNPTPTTFDVGVLDTPYHATNMSKLGILDSYHNYLTELHEYEKSQNVPEGVMNLNVVQLPVIPKEIEEYAKEYNLL